MPHGDIQRERPRVLARRDRPRVVGHLGHVRNPSSCDTTEPGHWCRAGDRRRRGRSRVQTLKWHLSASVRRLQEKKKSTPAAETATTNARVEMQSGPAETCFFFPISRPWSTQLFPRGGRETKSIVDASPSSRLLRVPHPPTRGVHGMFSEARREKRQNEHVLMPQTRSFFFSGGEPATPPCHQTSSATCTNAALSFVCAKIESSVVVCVCVCVWNAGQPLRRTGSAMHCLNHDLALRVSDNRPAKRNKKKGF
jgi:hypothetical protein